MLVSHKQNILQISKLYPTIVAQSSVILHEFAFEKNFCCFLDDNDTDTTCNKGKTEQRRLVKVI